MQHIKSYIMKGTLGRLVIFKRSGKLEVEMFTGGNYIGLILDRRSTLGHLTFIGGSFITWRSKKKMWLLFKC